MPIHGYPGGVITANPVAPTSTVATGVWTTEQQLQATSAGNWPRPGPPQPISRSLRFNSADSAYLNRTPTTPTNNKIWTWSGWVKRAAVGSANNQNLLNASTGGNFDAISIGGTGSTRTDQLFYVDAADGGYVTTTQVLRDVGAWYHIMVAMDTTQATASNRTKLYINGSQVTALSEANYHTQNYNTPINSAVVHNIGRLAFTGSQYADIYLTEVYFIDGQALTPSSFGQTNAATGVWEPIPYTGTYGTNGFYLNFSDNSGTTSTTLGADSSGNGNNWTPNNFSVTAGAGNDSMVDSPTSYGTDTGAGGEVRGNYAVQSPLYYGSSTITNGNLQSTAPTTTVLSSASSFQVSSGKWYWEVTVTTIQTGNQYPFIGAYRGIPASLTGAVRPGADTGVNGFSYRQSGPAYSDGTQVATWGSMANGDVIGFALDLTTLQVSVYKNNTLQGTITGLVAGTYTPADSEYNGSSVAYNFGQRAFAYTAPSGFKALCTQNLPTPTIGATSTTQANQYFDVELWTGNDTVRTITFGMQPDFIWTKGRNAAVGNRVSDSVRGASGGLMYNLVTNSTAAENTDTAITAIVSTGITLTSGNHPNNTGTTYVGWGWKGNGAGSTNTAGTITSTVSANTTSGFSIVSFTNVPVNASTYTIGHGLGVAPKFYIVKNRDIADDWYCYHASLGASARISLNTTAAAVTGAGIWGSTAPTSSVFSLVGNAMISVTTQRLIAYCFSEIAGYSAFGSYTGNGSADGPFIYTGMRPRFIMIKESSSTGSWSMLDTARSPNNAAGTNTTLWANLSDAEGGAAAALDILSNGFKIRDTDSDKNTNAQTYIYAAFAEFPFKTALAR